MISNKESTEKFIFISTHLMSWICFLSIFSVFLITIYRNFSRVNDIKVYIFLSAIFIFWYIPRSISYESWKNLIFTQATIQNISATKYASLEIPVPDTSEQQYILCFLDDELKKLESIESVIENQITTLTNYRKSLIHECVTGRRRITEADLAKVGANV